MRAPLARRTRRPDLATGAEGFQGNRMEPYPLDPIVERPQIAFKHELFQAFFQVRRRLRRLPGSAPAADSRQAPG